MCKSSIELSGYRGNYKGKLLNEIKDIVLSNPEKLAEIDYKETEDEIIGDKKTSLHYAILSEFPLDLIQLFIEKYPEALQMKTTTGCTPLIYASGRKNHKINMEIIYLLLDKYPDAVKIADNDNNIPLHYIAGKESIEITKKILNLYPEGVFHRNKLHQVPSDYIYNNDGMVVEFYKYNPQPHLLNPELIELLFEFISEDLLSDISINILTSLVSQNKYNEKNILICQRLNEILYFYDELKVKELYNSVDKFGAKISDVASNNCKLIFQKYMFFCGKYEYVSEEPLYKTKTSIIMLGKYHETNGNFNKQALEELEIESHNAEILELNHNNLVALKFIKNKSYFERECSNRKGLDSNYVIPIIDTIVIKRNQIKNKDFIWKKKWKMILIIV